MNENYISELMARMADPNQRWNAYRESEALKDIAVLPQLEPLVRQARKSKEIQSLAKILSELAKNTQHPQIAPLYAQLLEKPKLTGETIKYLVDGAYKAGFNQFSPWVRQHLGHKSGFTLSSVITYLGRAGDTDDLKAIGELLDRDCDGRCHPMFCIFAFEENGRREGIPYIERAVERHAKGRKNIDGDICAYGQIALNKFAGLPWESISELRDGTILEIITHHPDGTVTRRKPADEPKLESPSPSPGLIERFIKKYRPGQS